MQKQESNLLLLVEDHPFIQTAQKLLLNKAGYTVDTAYDGQNALTKASQKYYAIIVTDIQLPDMPGYELAQQLLAQCDVSQKHLLIALTTCTDELMQTQCHNAGIAHVLTKPLNLATFQSIVTQQIKM